MNQPILDQIEPEVMTKIMTRRTALRKAGLGTLAVLSVPVAIGLMTREAYGAFQPPIVADTLNFALLLERLEYQFYHTAVETPGLIPPEHRRIYETIREHERLHVDALDAVLLGQKSKRPDFDYTAGGQFPDVFNNYQTFSAVAQSFEDTGVRAYKGQAANLLNHGEILSVALRIHSVEARHAAQVRRLRGQKSWIIGSSRGDLPEFCQAVYNGEDKIPAVLMTATGREGTGDQWIPNSDLTEAFDEPLTRDAVLAIVQPFIRGM